MAAPTRRFAGETLRPIPQWPDYWASREGHIYSLKSGTFKQLVPTHNPGNGHVQVGLYRDDVRYERIIRGRTQLCVRAVLQRVKNLVAAAWLPPAPSPTHFVVCKDGNADNCSARNLAWLTCSEAVRLAKKRKHTRSDNHETQTPTSA